jgi:hypothetical protein
VKRFLALAAFGAAIVAVAAAAKPVATTQIAPTILKLLGLDPNQLKSVQIEHTAALPPG